MEINFRGLIFQTICECTVFMKGKLLLTFGSILFFFACSSGFLGNDSIKPLSTSPVIGNVGVYSGSLLINRFVESGIVILDSKVRLSVQKRKFDKGTLKKYNDKVIDKKDYLKIVDSIDVKPTYYRVKLSDEIGFIESMNAKQNKALINYLRVTNNNVLLSELFIYFSEDHSSKIDNAKEVYLMNSREGAYSLEVLGYENTREIIEFSQGVNFGFDFKEFCWRENYKKEPVIASFKKLNGSCPGSTKSDPEKVKSKDAFDKI